ncbi:hypothetical protein CVT25_007407 [Psilocybe cyanescens]|uniref:DUF6534 domain-containing protein n=1 Tax=Psilocybe cyanescens TaxID=93625 RepID=A0A409XG93_PSICY|nr:hypothetical protein CVT25_007407 [Psilocybe cyanescens]
MSHRFGPMLIGTFFNMILYGTYHYYLTFKRDAPWIKYLVLYLIIIESLNTGFNMAMMYQPLIEKFAISTPIQVFFAWRIKLLTKKNILPIIIIVLALISTGGGTYTTVLIVKLKLFSRKPELHWPALVWFLSACIADILITAVLSKRKTGFVATDDAVSKIIRMTVQTGMLTNFLWDLSLTKLYANCLLSSLNARAELQELAAYQSQHRQPSSSGGNRRHHILSSSMYELDTHKAYDRSRDVEYGVTITKIVETRKDPHSPETTETTQ